MIVDTSALIAALLAEEGHEKLLRALAEEEGLLPAPAFVEFRRVASRAPYLSDDKADLFLSDLLNRRLWQLTFTDEHSRAAATANRLYGIGVATGGTLNLLDLMVYACARVERRPILCTGRDFSDRCRHPPRQPRRLIRAAAPAAAGPRASRGSGQAAARARPAPHCPAD